MRRRLSLAMLAVALGVLTMMLSRAEAGETRVALVVGNGAYRHTTALSNPVNDARDMAAALKATGFEVIEAIDAEKRQLDGAMRAFADKLGAADVALFFYAGHGLQVGLQNYLVPVDARLEKERDLEFEAVKLEFILRQMEIDREGKTTIVILDACRDNPLAKNLARSMGTRSTAIGKGLAAAATGLGTFIAYSTQPGNVALDGEGRNSPFTSALSKHIQVKGRNLNATMIEVRKDVVATTGGRQVPWDHSALTGDFYFVRDFADRPGSPAAIASVGPNEPRVAPQEGTIDLATVQERLARLEAEAKTRPTAEQQADGMRLAELRARSASLDELVKSLQRKLHDVQLQQARAADPNEKQKLQRDVSNIMLEWTRRGQDLKKLRDEMAQLEGRADAAAAKPSAAVAALPVIPKAKAARENPDFEQADNVALTGTMIRSFKAPSPVACREACEADAACAGFQHGKKITNMGQCELFSAVKAREENPAWRSGVRR